MGPLFGAEQALSISLSCGPADPRIIRADLVATLGRVRSVSDPAEPSVAQRPEQSIQAAPKRDSIRKRENSGEKGKLGER